MLMVKPALAYLDVIRAVRGASRLPLAAYNVSGEYAAVKAAAANGWLDEAQVVREKPVGNPPRRRRSDHYLSRARCHRGGLAMSPARGNPRSIAWFDRALEVLPGGVSSPVRAFRGVGGTPKVIREGRGAEVVDEDGNRYLDFVGSWGPLILGHAHPSVVAAVEGAVGRGTSFGAPSAVEIELAEAVVACYSGIEQVRFVSSGTEAVMSAVRLARGATERELIVKFSGCYHGHVDDLLVAAGSGLATFGTPSSLGIPEPHAALTRVLPLDDDDAAAALFDHDGDRIAAVIIEPVPANNGLLLQRPEFLKLLRERCTRHGALLIFDEVISGFRLGPGGRGGPLRRAA